MLCVMRGCVLQRPAAGKHAATPFCPPPLCSAPSTWPYRQYAVIGVLLLFAILYVTVVSKRGRHEAWMVRAGVRAGWLSGGGMCAGLGWAG